MTITEVPHPTHQIDVVPTEPTEARTYSLASLAGPMAVVAGVVMTVSQIIWMPFDAKDWEATSTNSVFQAGSVLYLVGFVALLLALVGLYTKQAAKAGRFGLVSATVAIVGTTMLAGDLWFEAFAVPWLAEGPSPSVLDSDPSMLLGLGAVASYVLFAIGWAIFGIASFRARVFPRTLCVALVIAGLIGFQALLAPFGIPLALTVFALGVWTLRHKNS